MELREYEIMCRREEDYWWYLGLQDFLARMLDRMDPDRQRLRVLDAGCGTGMNLLLLGDRRPVGFDFSPEALRFCRDRGLTRICQASIAAMPFAERRFDLALSADVLCCVDDADEAAGIAEVFRALRPGGLFMIHLPALQWLFSHHDMAVHTRRRYTLSALRRKLQAAGFEILRDGYRNTALFPAVAAVRLLQRLRNPQPEEPDSDLKPLPGPINSMLAGLLRLENRLVAGGARMPIGVSVWAVGRRP